MLMFSLNYNNLVNLEIVISCKQFPKMWVETGGGWVPEVIQKGLVIWGGLIITSTLMELWQDKSFLQPKVEPIFSDTRALEDLL